MRPRKPKPGHRRHDWETHLHAWLDAARQRPHAYGRHDCMLFVASAVKAVTGKDYARGHRGRYGSAAGAARYLRRRGFSSPAAWIDSVLAERPVAFAQRGDVVLDDEGIPGICTGHEAVFVGREGVRDGLVTLGREHWTKAWAVGVPAEGAHGSEAAR